MSKEISCSSILIKQAKQLYIICVCECLVYTIMYNIINIFKHLCSFIAALIVNIIQYNKLFNLNII